MKEEFQNKDYKQEEKVEWIKIILELWRKRQLIFLSIAVFLVFGLLYIFLTPKEYKSEITLVVETNSSGSSMSSLLQQYGSLAGINLNKTDKEALVPELYPEVILSKPFLLEIMKQKVIESKYDSIITVEQYFDRYTRSSLIGILKGYTIGLPGKIINWVKGDTETDLDLSLFFNKNDSTIDTSFYPIFLTKKQDDIAESLSSCISTEGDFKKTNKFKISVELQDPIVVSQVTSYVVENLTRYIVEYRTKKAKTDLEFVSARTLEAESKYLEAQQTLAYYKDRNKNVILSSVLTEQERLQSEYNLAFQVYSALAQQLEQSKIKVQEVTPVFNVVDPAQIPIEKSKPKSSLIMIGMLFVGLCVGVAFVLVKASFLKFKKEILGK